MANRDQINILASSLTEDPDIIVENITPDPSEQIAEITTQPWQKWAKLVENSGVHVEKDRWSDPGVYPSGAGGGPRPSYDYVESVDLDMVFEILPELAALLDQDEKINGPIPYNEYFENNLMDVADSELRSDLPGARATWDIKREGNLVKFSIRDVDTSEVDLSPPEPDYDYDDRYYD